MPGPGDGGVPQAGDRLRREDRGPGTGAGTDPRWAGPGAHGWQARRRGLRVGYAPGTFDMFHIGHLNLLRRASLRCDLLIAGVLSDDVTLVLKGHRPVVPQDERLEIVSGLDVVAEAVLERTVDKLAAWRRLRFDVVFKGDDWQGSETWTRLEHDFGRVGVQVVYLPYTRHTSSTRLRRLLGIG